MSDSPSVLSALDEAFTALTADDIPDEGAVTSTEPEPQPDPPDEAGDEAGEPDEAPDEPADEDGEPDGDDDQDGEEPGAGEEVVELVAGQTVRLPDGTEVPVDKAVLFQADYTRKTQQLAEERREFDAEKQQVESLKQQVDETFELMKEWYEPRAANPTGWAAEILTGTDDPTRATAKVLYDLAQARRPDGTPVLDPKFVEMFGIEQGDIADTAQTVQRDDELAELRRKVEERERAEAEQAQLRERARQYQSEWDSIKLAYGLDFSEPTQEREAKQELLQFMRQTGIDRSLTDAYDLMQARKARQAPAPATEPVPAKKARATQAVTPRSSTTGASKAPKTDPPTVRGTLMDELERLAAGQ